MGPQSAAVSTSGFPMIVTLSKGEKAEQLVRFCEHFLRMKVIRMSAEEHDERMAFVHALTFFVARGLLNMGVHGADLVTPSFQRIIDLANLESHHSNDLFLTIQRGNAKSAAVRQKFIKVLEELNQEIEDV